MQCKEQNCNGEIEDGHCQICGEAQDLLPITEPAQIAEDPSSLLIASLTKIAQEIKAEGADDYTEWRKKSELYLLSIKHLETRELESREDLTLLGIPFSEVKLRDAAEIALRNCAHFAQSFEERISFVDSANRVRNVTWF